MRPNLRYLIYGTIFGIILIKVEAISWFRIQEMFYFDSFHMYGVLGSGILTAFLGLQLLKKFKGITAQPKPLEWKANATGGLLFGLGWGITGACTGPLFTLIGLQIWPALITLISAFLGTFIYAATKKYLPHA
jgi:uncharacterized membrane protein YedE/YeeE